MKCRALLGLVLAGAACGVPRDQPEPPYDGPAVAQTRPGPAEGAVDPGVALGVSFSAPMDGATISTRTFWLVAGTRAVASTVKFAGAMAILTPVSNLQPGTTYTATLSRQIKDEQGRSLPADYVWSFTTGSGADQPTVVAVSPASSAIEVSTRRRLFVTFSRPMETDALDEDAFTLAQGTVRVPGTVRWSEDQRTVSFAPDAPLAELREYTATVAAGMKGAGGAKMGAPFRWSFTTGACTQLPVSLQSAAHFTVLAGTQVSNSGPTSVVGDLGSSPGKIITGFPPGNFVGYLHRSDSSSDQAQLDLTAAFKSASERTRCDVALPGELGGRVLAPGLYRTVEPMQIEVGELRLDAAGDPDAIFIFQTPSSLKVSPGRKVILQGGAQARNVFWQIGTSVSLGSSSVFFGTVMAGLGIEVRSQAVVTGRVLSIAGDVTLDSCSLSAPVN